MLLCNVAYCVCILFSISVNAKSIKSKQVAEYEASGDYFEVSIDVSAEELIRVENESEIVSTESSAREEGTDDGVTCSMSNVTRVLHEYSLNNYVLVIFKLNVTENLKDLIL
jgi:hypothetical protein